MNGAEKRIGLITARRPSWSHSDELTRQRIRLQMSDIGEPSSPEDVGNFGKNLQIDMKGLVGDAVGNMSISPSSRDIVLAARRGLFIIDLEAPYEVPRFLPQGGTWDVADVQWNPHPSHQEFIVSTSSEKLLIWNLLLASKTSIEHILRSHYRAITDINWHNSEPDVVVSIGIDSWLWAWDLRQTRKPAFGLCAFNAGGTQVKWNRQDANILASSHMNEVLIWDRRKGSLPITRINAHKAKIYGIDWSHRRRNDIVTCSLDKTIKVWDIDGSPTDSGELQPKTTITTTYPVWRARGLPFGHGLLSLPQRGETTLEMWTYDDTDNPVEVFEGHTDVVKEFVWRKNNRGTDYQLITWSKDRTLRFWPLDHVSMYFPEKTCSPDHIEAPARDKYQSFRSTMPGNEVQPRLSAPIGNRAILAEVRAPLPPKTVNPVLQPHQGSSARGKTTDSAHSQTSQPRVGPNPMVIPLIPRKGETMSRPGTFGGRSARMDPVTWLSNVKIVSSREGSSGGESGRASRMSSRSRRVNDDRVEGSRRSESSSRNREGDGSQTLQDEITSVLRKFATYKVRLEKHDLTKGRTCTLGLNGPWGTNSSVFMRVTFKFPKDYPHTPTATAVPSVELDRTPLISLKDRALILHRVRAICERQRPCLEACLRFLLLRDEDELHGVRSGIESESSSEDEEPHLTRKSRDVTVSLLRRDKNLPEVRTSQAVFGPYGQLVCFSQVAPRIMRNTRDISISSSDGRESSQMAPRLFQSPALLSDAVRRLGHASADRIMPNGKKNEEGDDTARMMSTLLTFSQPKRRDSNGGKALDGWPSSQSLSHGHIRRSIVHLRSVGHLLGPDAAVAVDYVFTDTSLPAVCQRNAITASKHGRHDHERLFNMMHALLAGSPSMPGLATGTRQIFMRLYSELSNARDLQMLAMLSSILLQRCRFSQSHQRTSTSKIDSKESSKPKRLLAIASKANGGDYFSLHRPKEGRGFQSPIWPRLPSSPGATTPTYQLSTSNSSRGSWSSLFNAGNVRQFMYGVPEMSKEDGTNSPESGPVSKQLGDSIPVPEYAWRSSGTQSPRNRSYSRDTSAASATSKSWSEASAPPYVKPSVSFSSAGHSRQRTVSQNTPSTRLSNKVFVFDVGTEGASVVSSKRTQPCLDPQLIQQFVCHIVAYAELLFKWGLVNQRAELLKSVDSEVHDVIPDSGAKSEVIALVCTCQRCGSGLQRGDLGCLSCSDPSPSPLCSFCRLPTRGLSQMCPRCLHVAHLACATSRTWHVCATGCGCTCPTLPRGHEVPRYPPVIPPLTT